MTSVCRVPTARFPRSSSVLDGSRSKLKNSHLAGYVLNSLGQGIGCFGKLSKSVYGASADSPVHAKSEETPCAAKKGGRREKWGKREHGLRSVRTDN